MFHCLKIRLEKFIEMAVSQINICGLASKFAYWLAVVFAQFDKQLMRISADRNHSVKQVATSPTYDSRECAVSAVSALR